MTSILFLLQSSCTISRTKLKIISISSQSFYRKYNKYCRLLLTYFCSCIIISLNDISRYRRVSCGHAAMPCELGLRAPHLKINPLQCCLHFLNLFNFSCPETFFRQLMPHRVLSTNVERLTVFIN